MDRPTKMRLSYGDSVDLLGGTRITVLKSADRHPNFFTLRLQRIDYEEQVENSSPEPEQKQPLQGPDGEAPAADPGVGAPGPLPDAGPQEGQVVEGIGGETEEHLGEREAAFFGAVHDAIDDLHFAYSGARVSGCAVGTLVRPTKTLGASLNWDGGADLRLSLSASMTHPEDEADRPS